jgi:phosphoglycerol transferase MdoB-like AlkP superfamily enzyme
VLLLAFLTGFGLTLASLLITTQSLRVTLGWLAGKPLAVFACTVFLALLVLFVAGASRSLFAGGLVVSVPVLLGSLVDHFKNLITSTPLQISDFGLIGKMGNIAELNSASITFSRNSILAIVLTVLGLAALLVLSRPLRLKWKWSLSAAGAAALLFVLLFSVRSAANAWCFEPLGAELGTSYGQAYLDGKCGMPLGLWRAAISKADGYTLSQSAIDAALSDGQNYIDEIDGAGNDKKPNVIVILSESFFDVTKLPGVSYAEDPVSDFHRACAEGVSGTFYTRTLGYGTCNIELEVLTGINNRFLPSDEMLCYWGGERFDRLSTVPKIFQQNGYYTAFLHTFNDGIYNRTPIYTHLGFDDLYFSGDFAAIDPEAAAAPDYWAYMSGKIAGEFYSDDYMADLIIDLYQEKKDDCPIFLDVATMENHTPFAADKYAEYDYPFTSGLSEEGVGELNALTQGVADSSKALGKLIDYFSACDDPTVIIFFGDHRPGLPLSDGSTVYSALGMCGESNADWSIEELANLYSTNYVIWSNDESLLPGAAGSSMDTSCAFLGLEALRAGGMPLDSYWRMIASINQSCTAYTWQYFVAKDGTVSDSLPASLSDGDAQKFKDMTTLMRQALSTDGGEAAVDTLK